MLQADYKYPGNVRHIADFQNGLVLVREATKLARKHSHQRLLRRAHMLKTTFLNEATKFHLISTMLAEAIQRFAEVLAPRPQGAAGQGQALSLRMGSPLKM